MRKGGGGLGPVGSAGVMGFGGVLARVDSRSWNFFFGSLCLLIVALVRIICWLMVTAGVMEKGEREEVDGRSCHIGGVAR